MIRGGYRPKPPFLNSSYNNTYGSTYSSQPKRRNRVLPVIIFIVSVTLLSIGMYFVLRKTTHSKHASGKITNVYCGPVDNQGECIAQVEYKVDNKTYKATIKSTDVLVLDQQVEILYNPDDTYDVILWDYMNPVVIGWILIGIGALLFILGIFLI